MRFLTIPYFDEHFDLREPDALVGKTLMSAGSLVDGPLGNSAVLCGAALFSKPTVIIEKLSGGPVAVASDVREFIESRLENSGEMKDAVAAKLDVLQPGSEDCVTLSEAHLKNVVKQEEQKELAEMQTVFESWASQRKRQHARQDLAKEVLSRIDQVAAIKEDLKRREQLIFFFDREDELQVELQAKIPRYYGTPSKRLQKIIEKTKRRKEMKKAVDYVPPPL